MLMQYWFWFKVVDQIFQDFWNNDCLFEGLIIIMEENFVQIILIICQNTRAIIIEACI